MSGYRIVIGGMSHETNTFSTVKTTLEDFRPIYGDEIVETLKGTRSGVGGYIDVLEREGFEYVPIIMAAATPAGPLRNEDYREIVEKIKEGIRGAGRVDGVLLALHGAMIAEDVPEAEGTLLREVKALVGDTPVIVTLDLHGLISEMMVAHCDAIFGYDTNPHVDMYERGVEAAEAMVRTVRGEIRPVVAHRKLRMVPPTINQRTAEGPMVKLLETARRMEKQPDVLNVCLFPAFPYADVDRVGSAVVAVTDDNPGGGAPGDGTEILRELLKQGAENVGVACIKDPEAVAKAIEVGVRGTLNMDIGGKTDDYHGKPLRVKGTVRTITDGRFIHKAMAVGVPVDVGRTAVIDVQGVEIILTERSHAPNDPEVYRRNGVEPTDKKILVLKSRGHFRAAYEPFSRAVIEVDAPGLTTPNLEWFTYRNIPRPIWPFDNI